MGRNGEEINLRKSSYISSKEMVIGIIIIEGAHELVRSWVPQQLLISK